MRNKDSNIIIIISNLIQVQKINICLRSGQMFCGFQGSLSPQSLGYY